MSAPCSAMACAAAANRKLQGRGAEVNPGLLVSRAGLQHHTGVMPMSAHGGDHRRLCAIQVDENVACVLVAGVGQHIDVAPFAVAHTQKADSGSAAQLFRRPKSFARKRIPGLMVNQTNQVQLVGHGGELSADGMQSEKETAVVHDRNFAVETNRRTMNFQRTANCVLTVCLSPGGRFNSTGSNELQGSVVSIPNVEHRPKEYSNRSLGTLCQTTGKKAHVSTLLT